MRAEHRARARVQERHSFRFAPGFGLTRGVGILYGSDWTNASRRDLRTQPGVLTPGTRPITNRPEGAEDGNSDLPFVWSVSAYVKHRFYRPFRVGSFFNRHLGLKPQAESLSPFGTNSFENEHVKSWTL